METITLTQKLQNGWGERYIPYIYKKLKEKHGLTETQCKMERSEGKSELVFLKKDGCFSRLKRFADEYVSDILAIGYKYDFFKTALTLPLLDEEEKFLLRVALVGADYFDDKKFVLRRLSGLQNCSLDGVYNFRLNELKARWQGVAEYIPKDFGRYSLESFLDYLIEDGENRAYLKNGKAYDENYRVLDKSEVLGEPSLIAELLLYGAGQVYCFGETDEATACFLRKFYKEKAVFC